jgi:hypothetical protein
MINITTSKTLKMAGEEKIRGGFIPRPDEMVNIVTPSLAGKESEIEMYDAAGEAQSICSPHVRMSEKIHKHGGALHVPRLCHTLTKEKGKKVYMSSYEMLRKGFFDAKMSGNTLPADWQTLWDALRIDISIRKQAQGTVRGAFYSILNNPGASKTMNVTELFPYATIFVENNGEGQSVNQAETRGGQTEVVEHFIYAAGFTRTLLSELYDVSFDAARLSDSVLIGEQALQDDLSLSPIINFSYAGVSESQTPADTTGANRQEKLFNTLENAIDHLGRRLDPITDRQIAATDLRILCAPEDSRHIARVVNGLTTPEVGGQDNPKILPPINEISQIVAYDGEVIKGRVKDVTYTGVTRGKAYLVKPNRYMNISVKRPLTLESDMTPDVSTLAREKRAWYFVEGQQTTGIQYFVQEITLPAYTPAPS